MKITEADIQGLLSAHGALERDEMCSMLGASRENVAFPLANLVRAGEVLEDKPGTLQEMRPSRFRLAS
jgi:predicted ArsR family transcriptional regulator